MRSIQVKTSFIIALSAFATFLHAQTRTSLLEEFTGENCPPCAAYNPALDALLAQPSNAAKIIAIKWQVPIPTTPTSPSSLYQTNKPEIDWRHRGLGAGGYGYQYQYSTTSNLQDGVGNAPSALIDGKNQWTFGALSNHIYHLNSAAINSAAAVPTPFSITMSTAWNTAFNNCAVTITVTSASAFTALGNLMFRLCLVERYIEFPAAPGSNGEKKFRDAVRQSYPTTTSGGMVTGMGTLLPSTWTASQVQVFTVNCAIPSYINDRSQMAFVGFVQDDGDRQIYQAARTGEPSIPNDAEAVTINMPLVACTPTLLPTVTISNSGPNAITALTITPVVDGVAGTNISWTGNLAPAASTIIPLNLITTAAGAHTVAINISNVSGGDIVTTNNSREVTFLNASGFFPAPLTEGFEGAAFPPANWLLSNTGDENTFESSSNGGGYGTSSRSMGYQLYGALTGETDEVFLPPTDLAGTANSELKFDLAYQAKPGAIDSLFLWLSSDCANSWVKIYANGGPNMQTAQYFGNADFIPGPGQWTTVTLPLASYATSPQVLIKFKLKTDQGSGLYIDNVNLKGGTGNPPTGIYQLADHDLPFTVYPNPANTDAIITVDPASISGISFELENALGQVICKGTEQVQAGSGKVNIDCRNFAEGVYLLKLKSEKSSGTRKLVIAR